MDEKEINKILVSKWPFATISLRDRLLAKSMPTRTAYKEVRGISYNSLVFKILKIGEILDKYSTENEICALVKVDMTAVVVIAQFQDDLVRLTAYTKEGLPKWHRADKAIEKILE